MAQPKHSTFRVPQSEMEQALSAFQEADTTNRSGAVPQTHNAHRRIQRRDVGRQSYPPPFMT
jgi:hypothetical protein